jgi:hypothetical protein
MLVKLIKEDGKVRLVRSTRVGAVSWGWSGVTPAAISTDPTAGAP